MQRSIEELELEAAESSQRYQDIQNRVPRGQFPDYPQPERVNDFETPGDINLVSMGQLIVCDAVPVLVG